MKCSKKYSKIFFKGLLSVKIEIEKLNLLTKHGFFDFKNRGTVHIFMKLTSMNAKYINPISGKFFFEINVGDRCQNQVRNFFFENFKLSFHSCPLVEKNILSILFASLIRRFVWAQIWLQKTKKIQLSNLKGFFYFLQSNWGP